jgi:DNA-binding CsgD family transcriptional regulator
MRAVARAVAMLGDSAEPQLIGRLLSVDVTAVRKSILDLRAAGLLAGGGFRHPAATQAVLADVPAEDRPGWHSRVAELLHEEGAPARIVADHLLAAYDVGTASWPVASLRQAASDAMAAGDALAAVRYLRHGAGVCADPAQRARLTALLADAQWQLDPGTAARYLPDLTEYVRTGLLTGAEASVPIRHLRWQGDVAQADALEEILVAGSGAATDGATRSRAVFAATAVTNWWAVLDPKLAVHDVSPQIGRYLGAPGERPAAVSVPPRPGAHLGAGEWPEIADQTLRGLAAGSFLPTMLVMYASTHLERPEPALRRLRRLLSENWVARIPMRRAVIETMTSAAALRFGDPDGAAVSARSALATVAPEAWGVTVGIPLSALIRAAVAAADIDGALSYLKIPVPAAMFDTPFALPYLQAAGRYYLAVGEPEAALARFRSCGELAVSWRFDVSALAEWRNDAAAALLAMGRTEQARTLLEEELARLDERPSRARGVALWRLAAAGDAVERPALLAEAVRTLEASGDRIESVSARADLTLALEASATSLSGTAGRFAGGLPTALRRRSPAQAEPRDADTDRWPADGLAELTHAERRVAELAAAGDSNREIALKLFITVSTVEQHLTKVYRKLNVSRRSSLPAVLRGGLG